MNILSHFILCKKIYQNKAGVTFPVKDRAKLLPNNQNKKYFTKFYVKKTEHDEHQTIHPLL
jgi:hypothetical protein